MFPVLQTEPAARHYSHLTATTVNVARSFVYERGAELVLAVVNGGLVRVCVRAS